MDSGWTGNRSLRVICGGEELPHELALQLSHDVPGCGIFNGPTEATIYSVGHEFIATEEGGESGASVPIGLPIANTEAFVLDRHKSLVPIGVEGDLYWAALALPAAIGARLP